MRHFGMLEFFCPWQEKCSPSLGSGVAAVETRFWEPGLRVDRPQRSLRGKEDWKTRFWKQGEGTDLSNLARRRLSLTSSRKTYMNDGKEY